MQYGTNTPKAHGLLELPAQYPLCCCDLFSCNAQILRSWQQAANGVHIVVLEAPRAHRHELKLLTFQGDIPCTTNRIIR